jgi:adenosine deaminase CECR1
MIGIMSKSPNDVLGAMLIVLLVAFSTFAQPKQPARPSKSKKGNSYHQTRQNLLIQDSLGAFDADMVLGNSEKELDLRLQQLRKEMIAEYREQHFFPPAEYFYKSADHVYETRLFRLLKKMPKGGILHLHGPAAGDFHWIVDRAIAESDCYVYWGENNQDFVKGQLRFFNKNSVPEGFLSTSALSQQRPGFKAELYDLLTTDASLANDSTDIWREFENTFKRIGGFLHYEPVFLDYYRHVTAVLLEDNVQHVELREGLSGGLYDLENQRGAKFNSDTLMQRFGQVEAEARKSSPNFSLLLIYASSRFMDVASQRKDLVNAFNMRKKYPSRIIGYDLLAEEDKGNSTIFYLENWSMMDSLQKVYGVNMPLYLHDGESNWPEVDNLYDAALLKSKRFGHGFNLFRFPSVMKLAKETGIAVEISPLSNQILGYVGDLRNHPAVYYMKQGVPITISPDDPGVFGYRGVTPDYWAAYMAWGLDLQALKKIVFNSIEYSGLSPKEKAVHQEELAKKWNEWVEWANQQF